MNAPLAYIVLIESRRFLRGLVAALGATALLLSALGLGMARAAPASALDQEPTQAGA